VTAVAPNEPKNSSKALLLAHGALARRDVDPVLQLLAPNVEWWSQGVLLHRGEEAAGVFERLRSPVEITGIRKGADVVVFEFSRPWWKRRRAVHAVGASLGLRADQAVWLLNGQIRKIETRVHVPSPPTPA
jgi:hypothetical protein